MSTLEGYLEGKNADGIRLFRRFRQLAERCGPSETVVRRTIVYFRRKRIFAGAFVNGRRLELS